MKNITPRILAELSAARIWRYYSAAPSGRQSRGLSQPVPGYQARDFHPSRAVGWV